MLPSFILKCFLQVMSPALPKLIYTRPKVSWVTRLLSCYFSLCFASVRHGFLLFFVPPWPLAFDLSASVHVSLSMWLYHLSLNCLMSFGSLSLKFPHLNRVESAVCIRATSLTWFSDSHPLPTTPSPHSPRRWIVVTGYSWPGGLRKLLC